MKNIKTESKLAYWQARLQADKQAMSEQINKMNTREQLYLGTKEIEAVNGSKAKSAGNVRNIIYELIESQIDSTIPSPQVTAKNAGDEKLARIIENMLCNKLKELEFGVLNDMQERTTFIQGGSFFCVQWDNAKKSHSTVGEISLSLLHPKQVIVQSGVSNIENADYIIIQTAQTKKALERRYGVTVEQEQEEDGFLQSNSANDSTLTQNIAYYKNDNGAIGMFSWVNDTVLDDLEDFQQRQLRLCKKCGAVCNEKKCQCGSSLFEYKPQGYELLLKDIELSDGSVLNAAQVSGKIPFYSPKAYPIILRKNVSLFGRLLGGSDVDIISDQQETVKKLGTKINEKMMKAGSYVTLPKGVGIETSDRELKIIRLDTPSQKALIDVINVQADISLDRISLEDNYQWAKSTLGINDSFQGKSDATATSGRAKEFAAAQSAGRLESKRKMKNAAYAQLFEMIFKYMLSYADEPRSIIGKDNMGNTVYTTFNRYDFLKKDEAGEYYWNDEFIFSVDVTGGLAQNREAMWQQASEKFNSGAMGNKADIKTQILYWTLLSELQYPLAGTIKQNLEELLNENTQEKELIENEVQ